MTASTSRTLFTAFLVVAAAFGGFRAGQIVGPTGALPDSRQPTQAALTPASTADAAPGSATADVASDSTNPFALQCKAKTQAGAKMACYRVYFIHRLAAGGVDRALAALRILITTDPDVKRDVHMYAHGIGIDAYQMRPDMSVTFSHCTVEFSSGCYHGVMQAYFELHGTDDPGVVRTACQAYDGAPEKKWLLFQCLHGMGHGLDMTLNHDLPRALRGCDLLDEQWHRQSCYGGAFMENIATVTMPDHPSNALAAERGTGGRMDAMMDMSTGHAAHSTATPSHFVTYERNNLQYPCSIVDARYGVECYRIQTALILYLNHGDMAATAKACDQAAKPFRAACYQSLGRDITSYASYDRVRAMQYCNVGNTDLRGQCYVGIANTLMDEGAKPEAGFAVCRALTNTSYRKTCFSDAGEMLISLVATPAERERWCALQPDADRAACRAGARLDAQPVAAGPAPAARTTTSGGGG